MLFAKSTQLRGRRARRQKINIGKNRIFEKVLLVFQREQG
jgi:hypothetical protein